MTAQAEIEHEYHAYGGAADFLNSIEPEVLLDGPAGTGKSRAALHRIADLCEAYPRVRALICRATRTSCTESILVTLERDVIHGYPWIHRDVSRAQRDGYECVNGSVIVVGGLDHPERLYSTEWDIVYVAEATEITEDAWERFARAMRNKGIPMGVGGGPRQDGESPALDGDGKPRYWTQRMCDCNPGAPGHWLNQRANRGDIRRIVSRHADNPSISEDFLAGLRKLTGHRRARLYEGRWVGAEGSVYPEFQEDRHVIEPFPVPSHWPWWLWMDPGYQHPCAIVWMTAAPNGRLYVADEMVQAGKDVAWHCARISAGCAGRNVRQMFGDPHHAFNRTAQSPATIADQAAKCGIKLVPGPSCRNSTEIEAQVNQVRQLLTKDLDGKPGLVVFRSCVNVIRGFQSWSYKRNADGSVPGGDDRFEDVQDDEMDCVRGLVAANLRYKPDRVIVVG